MKPTNPTLMDVALAIAELLPFEDPSFSFRKFLTHVLEEIDDGADNTGALITAAEKTVHEIFEEQGRSHDRREVVAIETLHELFAV